MSEETKDFTVKDRRIFADSAEEDPKTGESETSGQAESSPDEQGSAKSSEHKKQAEELRMPEINFSTFVFSLNSSALVQLGMIPDPATGEESKNPVLAKQTIDILNMLQEKTRGNLTREEENLLNNLLYGLRMAYVKETG